MSPDRNQILRRRLLIRGSDPLDQAQRNFVLLCLTQQLIPFVAGRKSADLLMQFFDLIAQAIRVRPVFQDRELPTDTYP
jgi:hypothetical protein